MEQQTVTIAKAGIHASLNARCSVLAAANPVYGQYDRTRRPQDNIGLPDSLLSRFDLLFIVLDQMDPTLDRRISEHVVRSHQYRRPGTVMEPESLNQISRLDLDDRGDAATDCPVWLRGSSSSSAGSDILSKEFLRKYIHYAKNRIKPVLSEQAMECISNSYAQMRSRQSQRNLPITARTLETIIRLSSASAKARLSNSVEENDVETAVELLNFVLFHEIGESDAPDHETADRDGGSGRRKGGEETGGKIKRHNDDLAMEDDEFDDWGEEESLFGSGKRSKLDLDDSMGTMKVNKYSDRYKRLTSMLAEIGGEMGSTTEQRTVEIEIDDVLHRLNRELSSARSIAAPYEKAEIREMLVELERENRVSICFCNFHL